MAKSKSFWGLRRGSAGDLTFSRSSKGEQITRQKVSQMKNPMTLRQNVQRMQFAGVTKLRAKLNDIVNHSFEGEQPKITSLSEFVKRNLGVSSTRWGISDSQNNTRVAPNEFNFMAFKGGAGCASKCIIADGTLPSHEINGRVVNGGHDVVVADATLSFVSGETPTFGTLLTNAGVQRGDWLTFCILFNNYDEGNEASEYMNLDNFNFTWLRFKVREDADFEKLATVANMPEVFEIEQGGDIINLAYGMMSYEVDGVTRVGLGAYIEGGVMPCVYAGVVHSRDYGAKKLRSYTELAVPTGAEWYISADNAYDQCWVAALNTWVIGSAYILDGSDASYATYEPVDYYTFQENQGQSIRPVGPREEPVPESNTSKRKGGDESNTIKRKGGDK